ncbi:MAG: DUF302 domain-containing protein [Micrococcales bacterium]|jgi:uncharacterized protein (DUF302 family)|nr:DUF302 domain-containing protein [Micrococcales bacterium]
MTSGPHVTVDLPFDEALSATKAALAAEGFGVLTEIDMQATMKAKLNEDYPPLMILGACNPTFAHTAMGINPVIATLVPCNVVVRGGDDGVTVETVDPQVLVEATGEPELAPLADELRARLERALAAVSG